MARFIFRYRFQGSRVDMRLGTWPDKSLAELRALRDKARTLLRAGKDPRAAAGEEKAQATRAKAEKEARLTVRGLLERWDKLHLRRAEKALSQSSTMSRRRIPVVKVIALVPLS